MLNFFSQINVKAATDEGLSNLSSGQLNTYNPLNKSTAFNGSPKLADIISRVLSFVYPLAAMILFALLIWGGIQMMMGGMSGKEQSIKSGRDRVIAAIIGFAIVLGSLTIMLLIQSLLGIKIIGF